MHTVGEPFPATRTRSGLPLTTGARTWVDIAPYLGRDDRVVAGDATLFRKFATLGQIGSEVAARKNRRGIVAAREVVALLEPKAESAPETRIRLIVIDNNIDGFVVNGVVPDLLGEYLGQPDIHFPVPKVSLDYHGEHHFSDPRQRRKDIRKGEVLRSHGWIHLEFVAPDLHDHNKRRTAARIREAIGTMR